MLNLKNLSVNLKEADSEDGFENFVSFLSIFWKMLLLGLTLTVYFLRLSGVKTASL